MAMIKRLLLSAFAIALLSSPVAWATGPSEVQVQVTSTSGTILAANDISPAGRHGLCVKNIGSNPLSFQVANTNLPSWKPNTAYTVGQAVQDAAGNVQRVTTAGTTSGTLPTWGTAITNTVTDGTVVWTASVIGGAAIAADFTLLAPAASTGDLSEQCFEASDNALVPPGKVTAISASGSYVDVKSW